MLRNMAATARKERFKQNDNVFDYLLNNFRLCKANAIYHDKDFKV